MFAYDAEMFLCQKMSVEDGNRETGNVAREDGNNGGKKGGSVAWS